MQGVKLLQGGASLERPRNRRGRHRGSRFSSPRPARSIRLRSREHRTRSQTETKSLFWIAALDDAIDRETVEIHRSKEMLSRKERTAQTKAELALVTEEKHRLERHQDKLKRLLKQALLAAPSSSEATTAAPRRGRPTSARRSASSSEQVLPDVFDRFAEAAARVAKKDLESLLTSENLHGLTPVFAQLGLVRDVKGKPVFNTDSGPLAEVYARIENQYEYGIASTGKSLADEFAAEPYGWEFDMVRLLVVALVRAGKIEATSKGQTIDSALSVEARNTFENNNLFRQTSFRPKKGEVEFEDLLKAVGRVQERLRQGVARARARRGRGCRPRRSLQTRAGPPGHVYPLVSNRLPGSRRPRKGPRTSASDPHRAARHRPSSPSTAATASSRRRSSGPRNYSRH